MSRKNSASTYFVGPVQRPLCGGKRKYASRAEATQVKEEQELLTTNLHLKVYRCIDCKGWHLTRTDPDQDLL